MGFVSVNIQSVNPNGGWDVSERVWIRTVELECGRDIWM